MKLSAEARADRAMKKRMSEEAETLFKLLKKFESLMVPGFYREQAKIDELFFFCGEVKFHLNQIEGAE